MNEATYLLIIRRIGTSSTRVAPTPPIPHLHASFVLSASGLWFHGAGRTERWKMVDGEGAWSAGKGLGQDVELCTWEEGLRVNLGMESGMEVRGGVV
jgi:hypothetical protein